MKAAILTFIFVGTKFFSQNIPDKLDRSVKDFLGSPEAFSANISFYVADSSGKPIYKYNENKGLSTASTQKIFTAAAALYALGKDYQYTTQLGTGGRIGNNKLYGDLILRSNGDPTLGSWRYDGYTPEDFKQKVISALKAKKIGEITGNLIIDDSSFDFQTTPGGWPWNDMGNYYGAGVWGINWRENQFDMRMNGNKMLGTNIDMPGVLWVNTLKTAGSGDQSIIYTAPHSEVVHVAGSLPDKAITISGAMPDPPRVLGNEIKIWLNENGIIFKGDIITASGARIRQMAVNAKISENILSYKSPPLGRIVYWFLRKSVNMYGEDLVKTLGLEKKGEGSFVAGITYLKDFWKSKGIASQMINFADGSGLSPQNYVSAKAEVQALLWAKNQPWFNDFYDGFPTMSNGMKMKSGTMKDAKSFAGYHGNYVFSIIVNNYQGQNVSDALYKILNNLK